MVTTQAHATVAGSVFEEEREFTEADAGSEGRELAALAAHAGSAVDDHEELVAVIAFVHDRITSRNPPVLRHLLEVFAGARREEPDLVKVINEPVVASHGETYPHRPGVRLFVIAEPGLNTSVSVGRAQPPDPLILTKVTFGPGSIRPTAA